MRVLTIVIASALFSGCGSNSSADESLQTTGKDFAQKYKDKGPTAWIDILKGSTDSKSRSEAAEALGFIARQGRWTYGGFSDVPIDSPEPVRLLSVVGVIRDVTGNYFRICRCG